MNIKSFPLLSIIISFFIFGSFIASDTASAELGYWPSIEWSIVTSGGLVLSDKENRGGCSDDTIGGAVPGAEGDIASQAVCGPPVPPTVYNPGNIQPGATAFNTYSASNYYRDALGNSNGCTNISDDWLYFRTRLADTPVLGGQLKNGYWWSSFDLGNDGIIDFYTRVDGKGNNVNEYLDILYETTGDADPTGEPIVFSIQDPYTKGYVRAIQTPDNGTVGDQIEYFIDWQLPVTGFDDNLGNQVLCHGNSVILSNHSTSDTETDPFQKDYMMAAGVVSDPMVLANPEYEVLKTAADINGAPLVAGDIVEYTITIHNIASHLSAVTYKDLIPVGGTFQTNGYAAGSGIQVTIDGNTFNMTNAVDSPDTGGCTAAYTGCLADYNTTLANSVYFHNDWLYADTSTSPIYDTITIKYKVLYAAAGTYTNQGYSGTYQLPEATDKVISDDPGIDDGSDCVTANTFNCNDGVTGNDDPTSVTVITVPDLSTATKSHNVVPPVLPGATITYTITIPNTGISSANVSVTDVIDSAFGSPGNYVYTNCGAPSAGFAAPTLTFSSVMVTGLTTCTIKYDVSVDNPFINTNPEGYSINNSANIFPVYGSSTLVSVPAVTVNVTPNLSTSAKTFLDVNGGSIEPGDVLRYTLTLINSGDGTGTGINVTDTIDTDTQNLTNVNLTNCGTYTNSSTGTLLNIIGADVNPGTNCVINFDVSVKNPLINGTKIDNSATITAAVEGGVGATPSIPQQTVFSQPNLSTSTKSVLDVNGGTVEPGNTLRYTITINNTGKSPATGVDISDIIDSDTNNLTNFVFTNCGVAYTNNSLSPTVDIQDLDVAIGVACVVKYDVSVKNPTDEGATIVNGVTISPAAEGGPGATPSSVTQTVNATPNLSTSTKAVLDVNGGTVEPGDTLTYTINAINTGNGTGTGINITDTIDTDTQNLTNVNLTNCGTYTNSSTGTALNIVGADVAVGTNCVITFDVTVKTPLTEGTSITNAATITAAVEGGVGATPSSIAQTVNVTPNLSTSTKTVLDLNGANVEPGDTLRYTVTVKNTGNGPGTGINITDTIDTDTENLTNVNLTNCGTYTNSSTGTALNIVGADVTTTLNCVINFDVSVKIPLPPGTLIDNTATITAAIEGGVGATPSSPQQGIVSLPNLSTSTKSVLDVNGGTVEPGDTLTYTITLINTGKANGTGIDIGDTIDNDTENLSNFTFDAGCVAYTNNSASPTVDIQDVSVNVGTNCMITYDVDVKNPLDQGTLIDNQVTVNPAVEGGLGATPSSATQTVDATPNLSTSTKTVLDLNGGTVEPGDTLRYTITVINSGNGTGTGSNITDTIDTDTGSLTNVNYTNCGSFTDSSTGTQLNIIGADISTTLNCVITFDVTVKTPLTEGTSITNAATITAAVEGGVGATPSSPVQTVNVTPNLSTSTKAVLDLNGGNVEPGDTLRYTVTVKNTGNGPGNGINITDTIDTDTQNLTNVNLTNCGTYTNSSTGTALNIVGADVTTTLNCVINFDVSVKNPLANGTSIANTATIAAAVEGGPGAAPFSPAQTVISAPNLSTSTITENDADNSVTPGQAVTYTISIINTGNQDGTGIVVTETVDSDFGAPGVFTDNGQCGGGVVQGFIAPTQTFTGISVLSGATCEIYYTINVGSPKNQGTTLINSMTVAPAVEGGPGAGPVSASTLTVNATPNLVVTKTDNDVDNNVEPLQDVTYTITITNTGDGDATGVTATDNIDTDFGAPGSHTYLNCGPAPSVNFADPTLTYADLKITTVNPCVITFKVRVDSGFIGGATINNTVDVSAALEGGNDPAPAAAPDTLTVVVTPDFSNSSKAVVEFADESGGAPDGTVEALDVFQFTINVINTGNGDVLDADIEDTIDLNMENLSVVSLTNCGVYTDVSTLTKLDIQNVDVTLAAPCSIVFNARIIAGTAIGTIIPNTATISYPGIPNATPSSAPLNVGEIDSDGDGLSDATECSGGYPLCPGGGIGTDPNDWDTDDDGISDGDENGGTGPLSGFGPTDPLNFDTDGDGLSDGLEVGTSCANPASAVPPCVSDTDTGTTKTDPTDDDTDDDGILDGNEDANQDGAVTNSIGGTGTAGSGETDPNNDDTDGDGIQDGTESGLGAPQGTGTGISFRVDGDAGATTTDPLDTDTDDGGVTDGNEDNGVGGGTPFDGVINGSETDPNNFVDDDTDRDGIVDALEVILGSDPFDKDSDKDTVPDGVEAPSCSGVMACVPMDTDSDGTPDIFDTDDDGDTILTINEDINGNGDPRDDDTDGDGKPNYLDDDDDGDGILTKDEDANGNGDPRDDDTDCDGLVDYLDAVFTPGLCAGPVPPAAPAGPIAGGYREGTNLPTEDPGLPAEIILPQKSEACLSYNPERKILYTDKANDWTDPYVDFLSKIYLNNSLIDEYVISGDGSYLGSSEQTGLTTVRPDAETLRLEAVKMALISNCIPIYKGNERLHEGVDPSKLRPDMLDLPRNFDVSTTQITNISPDDLNFITNVMYTAYDLGIIDGRIKPDGTHHAEWDDEVTRAELLKIFINASDLQATAESLKGKIANPYADVPDDAWYAPYAAFAAQYRIVTEREDKKVFPENIANRGEVFALITRMIYITSNLDHENENSDQNTKNEELRTLINETFKDTQFDEFLFSLMDLKNRTAAL